MGLLMNSISGVFLSRIQPPLAQKYPRVFGNGFFESILVARFPQTSYLSRAMKLVYVRDILGALNSAGVRYLVAGGMAVNAHGYLRLTQDLDLVLQLTSSNILTAFDVLQTLGYRPLVPVTGQQFADVATRQVWIREKGMQVLNFFCSTRPETTLDIFVTEPFQFDEEYENATRGELTPQLVVPFVTIPTLIKMKRVAGRPKDLDDIEHLQWILMEGNKDVPNT